MSELNLSIDEKQRIQQLVEQLAEEDPRDADRFLRDYKLKNIPIWRRYIGAVYKQPVTWWIGILQTMMVTGAFGYKHQRNAQIRQSILHQALVRARKESSQPQYSERRAEILRYVIKHRLPELMGRLNGSIFTNYASTGGRMGSRTGRSLLLNLSLSGTNFAVASFGALIAGVDEGLKTDDIILAILTGKTGSVPAELHHLLTPQAKQEIDQVNQEFDHLKSLAVFKL